MITIVACGTAEIPYASFDVTITDARVTAACKVFTQFTTAHTSAPHTVTVADGSFTIHWDPNAGGFCSSDYGTGYAMWIATLES